MAARPAPHDATPTQRQGMVIHLLGGFRVAIDSRLIADHEWRLRKTKSLIKLLALSPAHQLHREQLLDRLWPDLPPELAAHNLHQTLYVARRTLDPQSKQALRYLEMQDEALCLCPRGPLWIDVEAFEAAAEQARRTRAPDAYQAALDLYGGELLPEDRYEEWVVRRRDALHQQYVRLLIELGQLWEARQAYDAGLERFQQALAADPANEEAHRGLMRLFALSGHRQQALRQYQLLQQSLQRELDAQPDAKSERLYREILVGPLGSSGASEPSPLQAARHNLPAPLTSFIGREREIAEVKRLLTPTPVPSPSPDDTSRQERGQGGEVRLLTLTGSGGTGKTRLALQAAADLVASFADGIWLVELASLAEPRLVPQAVATALGVREEQSRPLLATLVDYLRTKRLLLLLDNCEHLLEACARLSDAILHACPRVKIFTTSREALGIAGETTYRVPSLSLPDREHAALDALKQYESVRLFVERASAARSDFEMTDHNAPAVAQISRRLDGIPLALELAAARVRMFSVEEIAARLNACFDLLSAGSRTALPRQQTIRALIDWSYNLLTEPERALLRRLSVFAGGWTLEAAEQVCSEQSPVSSEESKLLTVHRSLFTDDVLDLLSHLIDKSLVMVEQQAGPTRYRLLETIRQYGQERLYEAGEATSVAQRHRDHFLRLAEQSEEELLGAHQLLWLRRLESEHDNLRAALAPAYAGAVRDGLDAKHADAFLRLCGALWGFWYLRGYLSEGRQWLSEALSMRERMAQLSPSVHVKVLVGAGTLAWARADYAQAMTLCQASVSLARTLEPMPSVVALSMMILGLMTQSHGDFSRAMALHQESLALLRAAGHKFGIALALNTLADAERLQGHYAQANALLQESLALHREIGDRWGIALALHHLGIVALDQGDYARAKSYNEQSVALFREVGNNWGIAKSLDVLGEVALQAGDNALATQRLEEALALYRRLEDRWGPALVLSKLAMVKRAEADLETAQRLCIESLRLANGAADLWSIITFLERLAGLAAARGQAMHAVRLLGSVQALREAVGIPRPLTLSGEYERSVAAARAQLDDLTFEAGWAEGASMRLEQAVEYAFSMADT